MTSSLDMIAAKAFAPCLLSNAVPSPWPLDGPRIPESVTDLFVSASIRMALHPQRNVRMTKIV